MVKPKTKSEQHRDCIMHVLRTSKMSMNSVRIVNELDKTFNLKISANTVSSNLGVLREEQKVKKTKLMRGYRIVGRREYAVFDTHWYDPDTLDRSFVQHQRNESVANAQSKVIRQKRKQVQLSFPFMID